MNYCFLSDVSIKKPITFNFHTVIVVQHYFVVIVIFPKFKFLLRIVKFQSYETVADETRLEKKKTI